MATIVLRVSCLPNVSDHSLCHPTWLTRLEIEHRDKMEVLSIILKTATYNRKSDSDRNVLNVDTHLLLVYLRTITRFLIFFAWSYCSFMMIFIKKKLPLLKFKCFMCLFILNSAIIKYSFKHLIGWLFLLYVKYLLCFSCTKMNKFRPLC